MRDVGVTDLRVESTLVENRSLNMLEGGLGCLEIANLFEAFW